MNICRLPWWEAPDVVPELRLDPLVAANVAIIVQPLHRPRKAGALSGDRVLHGGAMNLIHTTTQAAYDTRRLLSWIPDDQHAPAVGLAGLSLGSNVTAVVASLDGDLACAIADIPEADIVRSVRRAVEPRLPAFYERWGLSWLPLEKVLDVASPLALSPLVPPERRFIFAGLADRWVRPGNVAALWEHWDRCAIHWFQGSHLSACLEPSCTPLSTRLYAARFFDRRRTGRNAPRKLYPRPLKAAS